MVQSIATWQVEQYTSNVVLLAEQKLSRLRHTVRDQSVTGVAWDAEVIGGIDGVSEILERHGDTPIGDITHDRRWGVVRDFEHGLLIDKPDRLKMLVQPDNIYAMRQASAMARMMDTTIIQALSAPVMVGRNWGGSTVALPASQKIAHGSVGLTVDKLLEAKEILDKNEVDPSATRWLVLAARQIRNLLRNTQVTSADYNTVKALVNGEVNSFLGFQLIRTELLPFDGNGDRLCYAYLQGAVEFGTAQSPETKVSERPDKRHSTQLYTWASFGAMRVEEKQVVEIACDE